jgi:hypothetical protein
LKFRPDGNNALLKFGTRFMMGIQNFLCLLSRLGKPRPPRFDNVG